MSKKNNIISNIFEENGVLKKKNSLYKRRDSQVEAACMIYETICKKEHFIMEMGTGGGKSLTYSIPAVQYLVDNPDGKIVIVTSNISLQEQLFMKDIPFVIDAFKELYPKKKLERVLKPAVLKGINNFVCKYKYDNFYTIADSSDMKRLKPLSKFLEHTKTGDLNDIDFSLCNSIRNEVTTDSDSCNPKNCDYEKSCYSITHKEIAKSSNIIITNYHMFFSSYLAGSTIFSDTSIIIFDEAHEIENVLREYEAKQVTSNTVRYVLKKLSELRNKGKNICRPIEDINTEEMIEASDVFFENVQLKYLDGLYGSPKLINRQSDLPDSDNFRIAMLKVIKTLNKIIDIANGSKVDAMHEDTQYLLDGTQVIEDNSEKDSISEIKSIAKSLKKTCWQIINMVSNVDELLTDENKVLWVENEGEGVKIGLKDIDISESFRTNFLEEDSISCILSSATISVNNSFEYLKNKLGFSTIVNPNKRTVEFMGATPFNLTKQELWYLPKNTLPGNHPKFDTEMIPHIAEIIKATNGGALCLFTSMKNMNKCKEELPKYLNGHTLLSQGELSKKKILEVFRDDVDSSLLATKSFFTGVDIAGNSLRVVVIDKLPFASPTDPVQQKLNKRENAFFQYSLPEMIISLKQAVGRGVRTIDDKCVICILDERIATARYKGIIFNSMKYPKTSTRDIEVVKRFIENNKLK